MGALHNHVHNSYNFLETTMTTPHPNPAQGAGAADGFAGFGKFVPGFDFLQNLAVQSAAAAAKSKATTSPQLPGLGNWIAPTLNVEDLDKRIQELKSVQFWLDQNATALKATIQALEVQKMTLATLKGMNFNMTEVANAFTLKVAETFGGAAEAAPDKAKTFAGLEIPPTVFGTTPHADAAPAAVPRTEAPPASAATATPPTTSAPPAAAAAGVDPMQWWSALTQQFQTIAADAMQEVSRKAALAAPVQAVTGLAETASGVAVDNARALAAGMVDQTSKAMAGGAAAMGKALKHQAWPTPQPAPAAKKPAARAAAPGKRGAATAAKSRPAAAKKAPATKSAGSAPPTRSPSARAPVRKASR